VAGALRRYRIVSKVERQEFMSEQPAGSGRNRMDERVRRSKETVLATTIQLLTETGLSGVSVDEVSKRSGVAKTTIYRHWPSRTALLLDACSQMGPKMEQPDTGSLRGDLAELAAGMASRLRSRNFSSVLPSVIDAGERDPEIAAVHARLHAGIMAPLYAVIERGKRRGELPGECDASEIVAAVVGPLFYRRWFSREPLDEGFVQGVVDRAIGSSK
jgi:AcrR family transcriptional regulator